MTAKVLYVYLGNTAEKIEILANDPDEYSSIHLVDQDVVAADIEETNCNITLVNIRDVEYIQELLLSQMPFQHIVIYPVLQQLARAQSETELNKLLDKLFLFVKTLYMPVMRYKNTKIWFVDTTALYSSQPHLMENGDVLKVFRTGLTIFTKITAMELAKKMINVNMIKIQQPNYLPGLKGLLTWTLQGKLYLTAQELTI